MEPRQVAGLRGIAPATGNVRPDDLTGSSAGRGHNRCTRSADMLLASISFRSQPHKRDEALSGVDALVQRMRTSTGCARSRILCDAEDQNLFVVVSEWSDASAAETFFGSREFQIFKGLRILMREEPCIVLDDVRARVTRLMRAS